MKKSLLLIATIAMAMAACTKDAPETEFGAPVAPYGDICVNATIDGDTRTSMAPNADGGLDIAWVAGDGIGMFAKDANGAIGNNTKYTAATSEATSKFIIGVGETSIKWGEGEHTFYAYYPYSSEATNFTAVPIEVPAVQTQREAGNMDHLQPYAFLYAQKSVNASASVDLKFSNALSVLEVNLCSEFGSIDCEAVIFRAEDGGEVLSTEGATINLTDGVINTSAATNSNQIKVELTNNATLDTENPQSFYMMITPGHGGKRFSFYAVVNGKEVKLGSKKIPASGLPAGAKATIDLNVPAIDLSADGTANCYIVSKPSTTYKFKATVMGNGATTTGITPSAIAPTKAYLARTMVAANYYKGGTKYGSDATMNKLILRTSVELRNDGYIYFTTPATLCPGNAIIYATDDDDNVLWSWHMWIAPDYDPYKNALETFVGSTVMDRNLGAFNNGEGGTQDDIVASLGLAYQWGRKDPFMLTNLGGNTYGNYQTADGTIAETKYVSAIYPGGVKTEVSADAVALALDSWEDYVKYSIANPYSFIKGSGTNDYTWVSKGKTTAKDGWNVLWGNNDYDKSVGAGTKTIYDPCPIGWKVGAPKDYSFFNILGEDMSASDGYNKAWRYNWDQTKTPVTATADKVTIDASASQGYWFYGSTIEDKADAVRTDTRTTFFPALNNTFNSMIKYGANASGRNNELQIYSNSAYASDKNTTHRAYVKTDGTVKSTGSLSYEQLACAFPVRCVKDNDVITSDEMESAIDLSEVGTANCYIVSKANTLYKFKSTVKGNGTTALSGETADLTPATAAVLWSVANITDESPKANGGGWPTNLGNTKAATNLILKNSVELKEDGYIYFRTAAEMINGNVIICAKDAESNIVWSWHMWVLNGYDAAANDHYVTASNLNVYMMDRNLGATASPDRMATPTQNEWTQARGFYYQWGRKDPFMGSCKVVEGYAPKIIYNTPEGVDKEGYAQYGSEKLLNSINVQDIPGSTDVYTSVAYANAHPMTFIAGNGDGSYSWVWPNTDVDAPGTTAEWGKLWGNQTGTGDWDKGGVKTMYDPCPTGYRVPSAGHFRFITSHGDNAGAYYNKLAEWKYNCVEQLFNDAGEALNSANNVAPFGLNFYVKGSKTAAKGVAEGAQNRGVAPEDKTTAFFPAQGCINWGYSDNTYGKVDVTAHTNQVREPDFYGFSTLFMKAERKGEFYNNTNSASYAEQQAKALPVRCFRE